MEGGGIGNFVTSVPLECADGVCVVAGGTPAAQSPAPGGGGGGDVAPAPAPDAGNGDGGGSGGGGVAKLYGQCGGNNWSGPTQCGTGKVCKRKNAYYSQCVLDAKAKGVKLHGQCGGRRWTGPTECVPGATCVEVNEWYSSCRNSD